MIYDKDWNELENPDLEAGYLTRQEIGYTAQWVIDTPAVFERRVIAEYPNGGKDVKSVEVSPEVGHWEAIDDNGLSLPFAIEAPIKADKSKPHYLVARCDIYKPYTPEELEARALEAAQAKAKAEQEAEQKALLLGLGKWQEKREKEIEKITKAQQDFTDHFDDSVATTETVQSVLLALGEVGEMAANAQTQEEVVQSLMLAIAELGGMVAALLSEPEPETTPEMEEEPWQTSIID